MRCTILFLYIHDMGIRLIHKKAEGNVSAPEFQGLLDRLAALYANDMEFRYDPDQAAVIVSVSGRVVGSARTEGAMHTVIWAVLSLAEKAS